MPGIRQSGGAGGRLIYVSDSATNSVNFYAYHTGKLEGSLSSGLSEPQGPCSDAKGSVWIANTGDSNVLEYPHGSTIPSQTLAVSGEYPVGCAVDSKGDVAVSDLTSTSDGNGNVEIFKGGKGTPTSVTCPNLAKYYFLAYDDKGNLFIDGFASLSNSESGLCEIPKGSSAGQAITLSNPPGFPGSVQWDGKYLAIEDQDAGSIGRFQVRGSTGTLKGTVVLNGAYAYGFTLSSKSRALSSGSNGIGIYKYPAGGDPIQTLPIIASGSLTVSPMSVL